MKKSALFALLLGGFAFVGLTAVTYAYLQHKEYNKLLKAHMEKEMQCRIEVEKYKVLERLAQKNLEKAQQEVLKATQENKK